MGITFHAPRLYQSDHGKARRCVATVEIVTTDPHTVAHAPALIAAAPDLLEALEKALSYMLVAHRTIHGIAPSVPDDLLHSPQIDAARAAIAAARGEG